MGFAVKRTAEFSNWLTDLTDLAARDAILARIVRIQSGLMGDVKGLGGKLNEFRVDVGQGYRLYSMRTGKTVILLLIGGDKSTQAADIKRAREMIKIIEAAAKANVKGVAAVKPKKRK